MNYIICFWDKSKIQISEDMATKLKEAIQSELIKTFTIENSLYSVSGVEKIIPKDEAYQIYPEENYHLQELVTKQSSENFIRLNSGTKLIS